MEKALADLKTAQAELQAAQDELRGVKSDLKSTQIQVAVLQSKQNTGSSQCSCNQATPPSTLASADITSLKSDVSAMKTDIFHLQSQQSVTGSGTTFTRWGRTTCPVGNKIIYKGYTGGSYYSAKASSATILCLPEHPIYAVHTPHADGAYIYGTEYTTNFNGNPFQSLDDEDMPCVVCESETSRTAIMVPARNQCYPGWNLEYWGYLMGAKSSGSAAEYICVDKNPEAVPGGKADVDGKVLYIVESGCGSLPCPPYAENWEVTCAVCSK